jgi:hypothetical protein
MAQVGHVSAEMTRYYTHLSSGAKDDAVRKIAARNQGVRAVLDMTGEEPAHDTEIAGNAQSGTEEHGGD